MIQIIEDINLKQINGTTQNLKQKMILEILGIKKKNGKIIYINARLNLDIFRIENENIAKIQKIKVTNDDFFVIPHLPTKLNDSVADLLPKEIEKK